MRVCHHGDATLGGGSHLQIFMWHFKDNKDLVGVAFIDTEIYVHTAHSLKNFILIGDITRSVQLLRYQVCVFCVLEVCLWRHSPFGRRT